MIDAHLRGGQVKCGVCRFSTLRVELFDRYDEGSKLSFWCKEGRFKKTESEVLCAAAILEWIGAMRDVGRCKDALWDVKEERKHRSLLVSSWKQRHFLRLLTVHSQLGVSDAIPRVHPEDVPIGEPVSNRRCVGLGSDS